MTQSSPDRMERRTMLGVLGAGALLGLAAGEGPAAAAEASQPRQAWASRDGAVKLLAPDRVGSSFNPMDYLLIQETFSRFGIAHDEVQGEVLESLFTDDAKLEVAKGAGKPFQVIDGRKAIVANFLSVLSQQRDQRRHCISNVVMQHLTAAQASALAYGVVITAADGLSIGASVIYAGDLHREPKGHWRFSRLYIGMDDYAGQAPKV